MNASRASLVETEGSLCVRCLITKLWYYIFHEVHFQHMLYLICGILQEGDTAVFNVCAGNFHPLSQATVVLSRSMVKGIYFPQSTKLYLRYLNH